MGNVYCVPTEYDNDFELPVATSTAPKGVVSRLGCVKPAVDFEEEYSASFLRIHRDDLAQKSLIDPKEVTKGLIEQAEELIRRDKEGNEDSIVDANGEERQEERQNPPDDEDDQQQGDDEHDSCSVAASRITALSINGSRAPSVVTTLSAATQVVGNGVPTHKRWIKGGLSDHLRQSSTSPPKVRGGMAFNLHQSIHEEVKNVLQARKNLSERGLPLALPEQAFPCRLLVNNLIEDEWDVAYQRRVQEYTSVLHLKMKPYCVQYFHKHLARLIPNDPITLAVSSSITTTALSPPRTRSVVLPISSFENTGEIDFGIGPPSVPIRLLVTDHVFMDLAVTGCLGLVDRLKSRPRILDHNTLKSPDHYVVLLNRRSGFPLAVCALKAGSTGPPVVRMFATKRRVFGQRPAASTKKLGLNWTTESYPLYTWAEVVTEGRYPGKVRYSIYMAFGSDGKFEDLPSYRAVHETSGSPDIRVVGRTEYEDTHAGCAILSLCKNEDCLDEEDVYFRLSISKGIDPALFICFAAIVDEYLEKAMRTQFQNTAEALFRRSSNKRGL